MKLSSAQQEVVLRLHEGWIITKMYNKVYLVKIQQEDNGWFREKCKIYISPLTFNVLLRKLLIIPCEHGYKLSEEVG